MRLFTLLTVVVVTLVLSSPALAGAQPSDVGSIAAAKKQAAKKKAKRKACRKGYVRKTVRVQRKGKTVRVKRCRKRKAAKRPAATAPKSPAKPTAPAPPPGAVRPLFDPPGVMLEDQAARTYIERYLLNSRFTDCPAGWPRCDPEQRFSHFDGSVATNFYRCRLATASDQAIAFGSAFFYETGFVRPDGSWSFNEIVLNVGRPSFYEWTVATDGTVNGVYKLPGAEPELIGPLRYVPGARDCSA